LRDPFLGVAARGQPCPRHHLGDALAGFLDARRLRRALLEFRLALAIGAAATERGTFGKDLAVVFIVAARPIVTRFAARMFLPIGSTLGPLTRTIEFRTILTGTILARTRKPRTLFAATVVARSIKARLVKIPGISTGGTGIAPAAILALLPRLGIAALGAISIILARATIPSVALAIRGTASELLVAAEFSFWPIATRTITVTWRSRTKGTSPTRAIAVLTKTFTTRRIRPLVAKFLLGKARRRTGVSAVTVAIPARGAIITIKVRAISTRLERTLLAISILARAKIFPFTAIRTIAARAVVAVETRPRRIAEIPARRTITTITLAGIGLAGTRIGFLAKRSRAVGFPRIGTPFTVAIALARKTTFGEFFLGSPRSPGSAFASAGAALAAAWTIAPAAGIVVFVVIAGHEWSLGYR
jgi:hypothetical protein